MVLDNIGQGSQEYQQGQYQKTKHIKQSTQVIQKIKPCSHERLIEDAKDKADQETFVYNYEDFMAAQINKYLQQNLSLFIDVQGSQEQIQNDIQQTSEGNGLKKTKNFNYRGGYSSESPFSMDSLDLQQSLNKKIESAMTKEDLLKIFILIEHYTKKFQEDQTFIQDIQFKYKTLLKAIDQKEAIKKNIINILKSMHSSKRKIQLIQWQVSNYENLCINDPYMTKFIETQLEKLHVQVILQQNTQELMENLPDCQRFLQKYRLALIKLSWIKEKFSITTMTDIDLIIYEMLDSYILKAKILQLNQKINQKTSSNSAKQQIDNLYQRLQQTIQKYQEFPSYIKQANFNPHVKNVTKQSFQQEQKQMQYQLTKNHLLYIKSRLKNNNKQLE